MKKKCFSLILISLVFANLYPQKVLTLQECRELAIENNNTLKVADEQIRAAYYQRKEAFTKYFPELSFNGLYLRNQKNLNIISSSAIPSSLDIPAIGELFPGATVAVPDELRDKIQSVGEIDIKNIWVGGFNLTQPIFTGGKIVAYNDIQRYAEDLAKSQKNTQLTNVIIEVDTVYWQVVSLSHKKELAESYVNLMKKMEYDIVTMEEEGMATKADRLSVSVKLNEAEMTLTRVNNGLVLSKMLLSQICGLDITGEIVLTDEKKEYISLAEDYNEIPHVEEAWANRSELRSLRLAVEMRKQNEKIAFSEFLPNVGLTANYLWTNPSGFDGLRKSFGGMWSVGVAVSVPLNYFSSSAKVNTAKAQTMATRYQLEEAKEKIELQVNQSAYKITEAAKKLKTAEKNMEKADENLRYANIGFEEGVIPASDVMAAHTAWVSAHSDFIDAEIDMKLSKVYLNQALGRNLMNE